MTPIRLIDNSELPLLYDMLSRNRVTGFLTMLAIVPSLTHTALIFGIVQAFVPFKTYPFF